MKEKAIIEPASFSKWPKPEGLYDPQFEHDACGVGFVCHIKGEASHSIIEQGIQVLENLDHRGACGCDPNTGDGAGILVAMPDKFLRREARSLGFELPKKGEYAVANMFLPPDEKHRRQHEIMVEKIISDYDMVLLGWRDVPVRSNEIGHMARETEPRIRQCFVGMRQSFYNKADFERRLYLVRQIAENTSESLEMPGGYFFYFTAFSTNRMIYKGMLTTRQLARYFPDLQDPDFESHLALVHSRFSTNTFPAWHLAHPYRYLAHNGEINALRGNRNWMRARRGSLKSSVFGAELEKLFPLFSESVSDSASLDTALQFLVVNGRKLAHSILMLIPEAWDHHELMDPDLKAFYEYHAHLMEPWDGPAAIAFTDGTQIGAVLDRNGLRPARYIETVDGRVIMASESGVLPVADKDVKRSWRLQPGKIFLVDTREGRIVDDEEIKRDMMNLRPWRRWLDQNQVVLKHVPTASEVVKHDMSTLLLRQHAFGYTTEEIRLLLTPMMTSGQEAIGSMGTDTPLACLSDRPQLLYSYFKQLFAQVTNPPLDAIREELVTSLVTYLGCEGNLLEETPKHCRMVRLDSPIIDNEDLQKLRDLDLPGIKSATIPLLYRVANGVNGLRAALDEVRKRASRAVRDGACILILSDRGVDRDYAPIPSLLATAAVHHHLIREGSRTQCGLVIETGEAREVHHFALLIGYGAGAVNPYLAFETIADLHSKGVLPPKLSVEDADHYYIKAANKGLLKVASKMGISTIQSYRGAQIFEAIGLNRALIDEYFTFTASRIEGIGLETIAEECAIRHRRAFPPVQAAPEMLDGGGQYQWRADGEFHSWNPDTVSKLQIAVRSKADAPTTAAQVYKEFADASNDESRARCTLRGLMKIRKNPLPVPIDEVEPATEIVRRFVTGAMSLGSISKEAHENLAQAMNRLGGKSNTGEGGEDRERYADDRRSAIKQVASGRFGVTAEYLINADELQIKMAQGAKPGEGGQLPGHKVSEDIARVRHSTPGVGLISPPPHHDIYSIEDLAQLIHDLKNANPAARVSVKLVSEVGVGTVAAGVAKAKADHILISGDGGGTGASPLTSLKYAGIPWELGLAETQQVLVLNKLRSRVVVQVDGQLKTGRDVIIGALLGAEEFGFSTAPLIASGCIMMRVCHMNTCPVGIATQDPVLRAKFAGTPDHVINYFFFVAEEVRTIMAEMGIKRFVDLIGRADLLDFDIPSDHWKARGLDLSAILHIPNVDADVARRHTENQDHGLEHALDRELIRLAAPAIERGERVEATLKINNINRTVGTTLSGVVAKKYGNEGLPEDTINFKFTGSAGQSFGAFLAHGLFFHLTGEANDYLGKGLSGGKIVVKKEPRRMYPSHKNIIAGNVVCYGATSGEIYINGVVGERFCVRNSGANAIVEGVGDHGCEYMTGGRVVVLGQTGRNFAAGMSGGIAYVYDVDSKFAFKDRCNQEMVDLETLDAEDEVFVKAFIQRHIDHTGSERAAEVLANWKVSLFRFVKVMPRDYRRVLEQRKAAGNGSAAALAAAGKH